MAKLQNALAKKIPVWRKEIRTLVKKHGGKKISDVTVLQAYGGMRGVKGVVCDNCRPLQVGRVEPLQWPWPNTDTHEAGQLLGKLKSIQAICNGGMRAQHKVDAILAIIEGAE